MDRSPLVRNIIFILLFVGIIALAFSFEVFFKILLVIVGFGAIIFVHELGHFIAAKATGVRVHRFYLGFCPTIEIPEGEYRFLWIGPKFHFPGFNWQMKLFSMQVGETEYGVGLLPLGGFVHMAGEPGSEEAETGGTTDPRDFTVKPAWARSTILVAGAFMNVVFAFVFFIAAFLVGVDFVSPEIGQVLSTIPVVSPDGRVTAVPGPAWAAGIESGDEIVAVNGKPYQEFSEIVTEIKLLPAGSNVTLTVERPLPDGGRKRISFTMKPIPGPQGFQVGLTPVQSLKAGKFIKGSPAANSGMKLGSTIDSVTFGNETTAVSDVKSLALAIKDRAGQTGVFQVRRRDGVKEQIKMSIERPSGAQDWQLGFVQGGQLTVFAHRASTKQEIITSFPKGAVITEVTVTDAGGGQKTHKLFSKSGLEHVIKTADGNLEFKVRLHAIESSVNVDANRFKKDYLPDLAMETTPPELGVVVGRVEPGSAIDEKGITAGDTLLAIGGAPLKGFIDAMIAIQNSKGESIKLTYLDAKSDEKKIIDIRPRRPKDGTIGIFFEPKMFTLTRGPWEACVLGVNRTWLWGKRIFLILRSLFTGTVEAKNLAGPVGILNIMYLITQYGIGKYMYILGLICINLAIVNLLPIPLLDGGHLMIILIEKIIRRPVPLRYQNAAAWVGLILILSLLVFTTFWDIKRLFLY
jgi:regulator of sigma E protease